MHPSPHATIADHEDLIGCHDLDFTAQQRDDPRQCRDERESENPYSRRERRGEDHAIENCDHCSTSCLRAKSKIRKLQTPAMFHVPLMNMLCSTFVPFVKLDFRGKLG
ncbi:hypothetical protein [Sphingomonas panacis]|uniref:hypothetical protein n=1 Tax=Sphingomonas panacis TaxID=1560345 RepID=UPI001470AC88|nr:hypothetical protein [Sphingomonas panacis]